MASSPGGPLSGLDMIIAAVAGANGCVIVTDNERDFAGLQIVNPLKEANLEGLIATDEKKAKRE